MRAEELRIGNLFKDKHSRKIIEVIELSKNKITFDGCFYGEWQAEPIPLTEKILLKCGFCFEKFYSDDENKWLYLQSGRHKFDTDTSCGYKTVWYNRGLVKVKTLHQLQNLYFALTGEELNIKL